MGTGVDAPPQVAVRRIRAELRATPDVGQGTFESVVSVFGVEYDIGWSWSELIRAGAFDASIADQPSIPINWQHAWQLGPIGDGVPSVEGANLMVRGSLYLDLDPLVQRVWRAMQAQAVREWSIAFLPQTIVTEDSNPYCDQIQLADLIEASVVYRGAHPDTETLDMRNAPLVSIDGGTEVAEREVIRLRTLFGHGPRERAAIPVHHTPTDDGTWDGPANEKNLSNDDGAAEYKQAFAWVNPDADADKKNAYAFIHHDVDSEGKVGDANLTACSSGIAVLNGGRGGSADADWWGDREGIYKHLAAHLTDGGKTPPDLQAEEDATKKDTAPSVALLRWKEVKARLARMRAEAGETDDEDEPEPADIAQALDAVIDEIAEALDAGDLKGASDLALAADSTSDDLLEALGVPDDDDLEESERAADADRLRTLLGTRAGTELLLAERRAASTNPPSS